MKTTLKMSVLAGAVSAALSLPALAAELILPEVETCGTAIQTALSGGLNNLQCLAGTVGDGSTMNTSGTYIASFHDEFLSYSIEALETIQKENESMLPIDTYGDWSKLVAGSGQLDVGVMIKASGGGVLNNDDPFPDAADSNTSDPIYVRTWGGDDGTDTHDAPPPDTIDPVLTVQEVVDWLSPQKIPVFYFDLADPQNVTDAALYFIGQIFVTNADGTQVLDTWALDNNFDGEYDGTDGTSEIPPVPLVLDPYAVLAPKNVPVYIPGSGCTDFTSGALILGTDWCKITNSRGSGSPEFIAYAPDMDLSQWANGGNLFWGEFKIAATGAADEEIYLTKRVGTTQVPEPGVLSLLGLGLLGLGASRRRRAAR